MNKYYSHFCTQIIVGMPSKMITFHLYMVFGRGLGRKWRCSCRPKCYFVPDSVLFSMPFINLCWALRSKSRHFSETKAYNSFFQWQTLSGLKFLSQGRLLLYTLESPVGEWLSPVVPCNTNGYLFM